MSTLLNTVLPILGGLLLLAAIYHLHKRKLRIHRAVKKDPPGGTPVPNSVDHQDLEGSGSQFFGMYWNSPYEITTGNH